MSTKITYDGNEIANFSSGGKVLKCEGKTMNTDVIVETEDLTALNTEINELDGTTGTKSVAQMTTAVSNANDEVDDQSALIEQIQTALQSKSGGGGEDEYIELPPVSEWESTALRLETDNAKYKISSNYTLPEGYRLYVVGNNIELHIKDDIEFIINGDMYGHSFIYNDGIIEGSASFLNVSYLKNKGIVNARFIAVDTVDNYGYMINSPSLGLLDSIHTNYGRIDINNNCEFDGHITNDGYIFMKSADISLYGTIDNTNNGMIEVTDFNTRFYNYGEIINTNNDKHGYINVFNSSFTNVDDGTVINTISTYIKNIMGAMSDDIPHVDYKQS